jgi:hypothetical protein
MGSNLTSDQIIAAIAGRQAGRVSREQLLDAGITMGEIKSRVRRGRLIARNHGVCAVGSGHSSLDALRWEAILAGGKGAVLAKGAALRKWGVIRYDQPIEIITPRRVRKKGLRSDFVVLPDDEMTECDGMPITTVCRALLDASATWKASAVTRALNQAEAEGLYEYLPLATLVDRYPRHPGAAKVRAILADRDPAIALSPWEDELHDWIFERFPRPLVNAWIEVDGRMFRPDFAWVEAQAMLEADSRFHDTADQKDKDDERDAYLQARGWAVVRVRKRRWRRNPARVEAEIRGVLNRPLAAAA